MTTTRRDEQAEKMYRVYSVQGVIVAAEDPREAAEMIRKQLVGMDADFHWVTLTHDDDEQGSDITTEVICANKDISAGCTLTPGHDGECNYPRRAEAADSQACCDTRGWELPRWEPARAGTVRVRVGISGVFGPYEATIHDFNGRIIVPGFDRGTVERIAADTQTEHAKNGSSGQYEVITLRADGIAEARLFFDGEDQGLNGEVHPDENGIYWWGALEWQWDQIEILAEPVSADEAGIV